MDLTKKLLTLLAIFCIIASAGVVCAADAGTDGGYAGSNYEDMNGAAGSQYMNEAETAGTNQDILEPGNGLPLENQTGYVPLDANGNPINGTHAAGNTVANATNTTNTTHPVANATVGNTSNATHHPANTMPATGNPVIGLLAAVGIIGGYAALRKNQ